MDLGVVSRPVASSNDAISSANTVTAQDFNLTASQLTTMAKTDDLFRNAKNIVNNYDPVTGVYYQLTTLYHFSGNYNTLTSPLSDPAYTSIGASVGVATTSTEVTMSNLCKGSASVAFIPSDLVSNGVATFGPLTPLSSVGMTCDTIAANGGTYQQTSVGSGGNISAANPFGTLIFGPYGRYPVLPARWDVTVNGVIKAQFDISGTSPPMTSDGRPKGYVPSFKINVDGTKKITSVDIKWYYYDPATGSYAALATADLKLLKPVIGNLEVKLNNQGSGKYCGMTIDPVIVTQVSPADPSFNCSDTWYFNDSTHPATNAGLMGSYQTGGLGYIFDFFLPTP
jgi:hypothetical protein